MKRKNLSTKERCKIQNKTYIWAEVFFFLTCDQAIFVFFLCHGLDPIPTQSNHLLGNPRYTLTERLLANLTHLPFVFGFFLARKNGFDSVWFSEQVKFQGLCCLVFLASPWPFWVTLRRTISHSHSAHGALRMKDYYGISQKFLEWRIMKADFKKIIRV